MGALLQVVPVACLARRRHPRRTLYIEKCQTWPRNWRKVQNAFTFAAVMLEGTLATFILQGLIYLQVAILGLFFRNNFPPQPSGADLNVIVFLHNSSGTLL